MGLTNFKPFAVTMITTALFASNLPPCYPLVQNGFSLQALQGRTFYVIPNNNFPCPGNLSQCHTLDWYSNNVTELSVSNTTVKFINGSHVLSAPVHIANVSNIKFIGEKSVSHNSNGLPYLTSWITCNGSDSGFFFSNVSNVQIENLGFYHCQTTHPLRSCHYNLSAALSFHQGSDIFLSQVIINNTKGFGLHVSNVFGSISVHRSAFLRATITNARFRFGKRCGDVCSHTGTNVLITSSWFMDGRKKANGLNIVIYCPNVSIVISDVMIQNNFGFKGGNLAISLMDFGSINSSIINISNSIIDRGRARKGGGLRVWSRANRTEHSSCKLHNNHTLLYVYNTTFTSNFAYVTGGAVYVAYYPNGGYDCIIRSVVFKNCRFVNNFGNGAVMEATKHMILANHGSPPVSVSFDNCSISNNSSPSNKKGPILNLIRTYALISNSNFTGSSGTAISLRSSKLNFYGNVRFEDNHADYGGALKVCEGSLIFLHNNSHIQFTNNHAAIMGGAIFASQSCLDTLPSCIFQPTLKQNVSVEDFGNYLNLEFVNNSANIAGDALYGGSVDNCYTIGSYYYGNQSKQLSKQIFNKIADMRGQSGPSQVSSYPYKVCFCDDADRYCNTTHETIEVYPGERFNISAVTVGQLNGYTLGIIQATLTGRDHLHKLVYNPGNPRNECTNLTFSLLSNRQNATIKLYSTTSSYGTNFTVSLLPCPLGFEFDEEKGVCDCRKVFDVIYSDTNSLECDIDTKTICVANRRKAMWFGCLDTSNSPNESTCDDFTVSTSCDYYCKHSSCIDITNLDDQCLSGRTGVLCGACKPGLSRVIGQSFACKKCSNTHLLFWFQFIFSLECF